MYYLLKIQATVNFEIIAFSVEIDYDRLVVYDGPTTSSQVLRVLTGSAQDFQVVGTNFLVLFTVDRRTVDYGFQIAATIGICINAIK